MKWEFKTQLYSGIPVAGDDGTVYVGESWKYYEKRFHALNPDGSPRWAFTCRGSVSLRPRINNDGTILFTAGLGWNTNIYNFYLLNPDGTERWRLPMLWFSTEYIYRGDILYVLSSIEEYTDENGETDRTGYGIHAVGADGFLEWSFLPEDSGFGPWLRELEIGLDGTLFVARQHILYAVNPDGSQKWTLSMEEETAHMTTGPDGAIHTVSKSGVLQRVTPDQGTPAWKFQMGAAAATPPVVSRDGTLHVVSDEQILYAVNPDGSLKWKYEIGEKVDQVPVLDDDGNLYFISEAEVANQNPATPIPGDDTLHALSPDGTLKWKLETGQNTRPPIIGPGGVVLVFLEDKGLQALNPDGTPKWFGELEGANLYRELSVGADGTVYLSSQRSVYAFEGTPPAPLAVSFTTEETAPLEIAFSPRVEGGIPPYTYSWDFGDGGSGGDENPVHAYAAGGTYSVTLIAHDSSGSSAETSMTITVTVSGGAVDSDEDGVIDPWDKCPDTFTGSFTNREGCSGAQLESPPEGGYLQADLDAKYDEGYKAGLALCEDNQPPPAPVDNCATYDLLTNLFHVPCFKDVKQDTKYRLDFKIVTTAPTRLELVDIEAH